MGTRSISSTPRKQAQLPDFNRKDKAAVGVSFNPLARTRRPDDEQVFTPKAAALFVATGVGLFFYLKYEKQKLAEQRRGSRFLISSAQLTRSHPANA